MQKKRFLENQQVGIEYASFLGEVYEAYFYESLLNVIQQENLNLRLAAKGPYVPVKRPYVKTGFVCTIDGKCVYNMHGVAFAEFDCLALSDDMVYFYECSISNKCNVALKKEMLKKKVLLEYLFPTHTVVPVVVSGHESVVAYCERWQDDGIEAWHVAMADEDGKVLALAQSNQPRALPKPKQVMSLQELNYLSEATPYFEQLGVLTQSVGSANSLQDAYAQCQEIKRDWFSRLYWGMVSGASVGMEAAQNWDKVIVAVDFSKNVYPVLRYYAYSADSQRLFEFTPELESLKRIKFSRLELLKVLPLLSVKSDEAFASLQQELQQWRKTVLKPHQLLQTG